MKINIDGPYREKRGLAQELRAYIMIAKIIAITAILLIGIHTINQLDEVMSQQAIQDKTISDAMDQLMWIRQDIDELKNTEAEIADLSEETEKDNQVVAESVKVAETEEKEPNTTYGNYEITHYCKCARCCGKNDGITATGTQATAGRTIAVDPKVIPLGTEVIIDGQHYIAEDTGGAIKGNKIDIFCDSHEEAINRGRTTREVFAKEE
jgi:3D (Asp-Asp-Asp) domain-containing protein